MENQNYNNEVYSANFTSGNRTYFINMLEAKNKSKYVKITESRKVADNEFQKNRIMLFQNDLFKLSRVLDKAIGRIRTKDNEGIVNNSLVPDGSRKEEEFEAETEEVSSSDTEFPNSGKRWTTEDEEKLEFLFKAGKTIDDLTEIFGRRPGGIETRLQKLHLAE
ncbi:MAG: DUF3276 family protein [Candidatus Delongbacteria bacterium]